MLSRHDLIGHTLSPPCVFLLLVNVGDYCDRVASALPSQTVMGCWRGNAARSHFTAVLDSKRQTIEKYVGDFTRRRYETDCHK